MKEWFELSSIAVNKTLKLTRAAQVAHCTRAIKTQHSKDEGVIGRPQLIAQVRTQGGKDLDSIPCWVDECRGKT